MYGGENASFFILKQLPVISTIEKNYHLLIANRILELTYTSWELELFAQDLGYLVRFSLGRRSCFLLRCELDAAFFQLYLWENEEWHEQGTRTLEAFPNLGCPRYIMETFRLSNGRMKRSTKFSN